MNCRPHSVHLHPTVRPHQLLKAGPAHTIGLCAACGRVAHDEVTCRPCIQWRAKKTKVLE